MVALLLLAMSLITLVGNLNASTMESTTTKTNSRVQYDHSLAEQIKSMIKAMNPVCSTLPKVCGSCMCLDDPRLSKRYYCSCLDVAPQRDCLAHLEAGNKVSGVYSINPVGQLLNVYCDQQTDNGGWVVFQRRLDGGTNFYRGWEEYVAGFGELHNEMWLGNERIFLLVYQAMYPHESQLRVEMEDFDGRKVYAHYDTFQMGDKLTKYTLRISGYRGSAGDSLDYHNGMQFSTYDKDNDRNSGNCAKARKNAWWYNNCDYSGLNGVYSVVDAAPSSTGIYWQTFGNYGAKKSVEMKLRRKTSGLLG